MVVDMLSLFYAWPGLPGQLLDVDEDFYTLRLLEFEREFEVKLCPIGRPCCTTTSHQEST